MLGAALPALKAELNKTHSTGCAARMIGRLIAVRPQQQQQQQKLHYYMPVCKYMSTEQTPTRHQIGQIQIQTKRQ